MERTFEPRGSAYENARRSMDQSMNHEIITKKAAEGREVIN